MGITAYLVPGAEAPKNVHLFYNKRSGNIGVKIKSSISSSKDPDNSYGATGEDRRGIIAQSSNLDHTVISSMRIIVAVVESAPSTSTSGGCGCDKASGCGCDNTSGCGCKKGRDVAIVSPYYQKVTTVPAGISSVAVAADDKNDTVWVYTLTGDDDTFASLSRTTVGTGIPKPLGIKPNNAPAHRQSSLSAHYNTVLEKPFVYYQTTGIQNYFYEYSFEDEKSTNTIEVNDLDNDKAHPFTVVWVKEINTLYCYYVNKLKVLKRLTQVINSKSVVRNWSDVATTIEKGNTVPFSAQLTVVPSQNDRRNNIFFLDENYGFTHWIDKWAEV